MGSEGPLPGCRLLVVSSHGGARSPVASLCKIKNPIHEGSLMTYTFLQVLPTTFGGVSISIYKFGGGHHIQTIAILKMKPLEKSCIPLPECTLQGNNFWGR